MMNKFIVYGIVLFLLTGCATTVGEKSGLIEGEQIISISTYTERSREDVYKILVPLLEGIYMENKMIQGATYQEEMTLEDLREFMLEYYTEELVNETCELILYKSELGHGIEYSGMYNYDQETDIFYLENSRGLEIFPEDAKITIDEIMTQTEDRIEIRAQTNWKLLYDNGSIGSDGYRNDYLVTIILEKEGHSWYLGDLVFSRTTINEANREYRGQ